MAYTLLSTVELEKKAQNLDVVGKELVAIIVELQNTILDLESRVETLEAV